MENSSKFYMVKRKLLRNIIKSGRSECFAKQGESKDN